MIPDPQPTTFVDLVNEVSRGLDEILMTDRDEDDYPYYDEYLFDEESIDYGN